MSLLLRVMLLPLVVSCCFVLLLMSLLLLVLRVLLVVLGRGVVDVVAAVLVKFCVIWGRPGNTPRLVLVTGRVAFKLQSCSWCYR